jgi:hypothetical protein
VSVLVHPVVVGSAPVLWRDWSRRVHRHACMQLLRNPRVTVQVEPGDAIPIVIAAPLSRAERAHARLSWDKRLARNARAPSEARPTITLFGVPDTFAACLGLRAF